MTGKGVICLYYLAVDKVERKTVNIWSWIIENGIFEGIKLVII